MRSKWVFLLLLLASVWSAPASAQNSASRLIGTIKDDQGGVLPGVTVTATSPSLIGSQAAVSEANGSYQFPSLPPGGYALTFELQGFQTVARTAIQLASGQTLTIDVQLPVAGLQETVTVSSAAPLLDTTTTAIGNVLDQAKLTSVPTSSDLWGALAQTPGVRLGGFDVGGSHKIQSTSYDAFGISGQVRVLTEGVDQTEGASGAGFYQDYYANSEIAVSAAGQDVTTSSPGALVVATIKSGGNQFKAFLNQTYEGRGFVGDNVDAASAARGFTGQPNILFWESHGDLGGPVLRDKLWFFGSANHFHIDKLISGVPEQVATDLGLVDDLTTKENWKPTANDTVLAYYQHQHKQQPRRGLAVTRGPASTLMQSSYAWMYNARWQRVWSNRLFTEVNTGQWGYNFPLIPSTDYRTSPPRTDLVTGVDTGAGFTQGGTAGPTTANPRKPQVFANATYFLPTGRSGSHDLKAGFEWLDDAGSSGATGTSGPILYLDSNGAPTQIRLTDVGDPATFGTAWTPSVDANRHLSLYAQDRWTVAPRVTITAGLRYDRQRPYYESATRTPLLTEVFSAVTTPGQTLLVSNQIAPRAGVSWDPTGSSRSAVKAFWGRYFHNLSTFASVDPGGTNTRTYLFNDANRNGLYDGRQELGSLVASSGGASTTLDPALKTPHTDELDLSYQRQFWGESSARVAYVRKMTRDQIATYNASWAGQFSVPVAIPVTLRSYDGGISGTQTFTVYDISAALRGVVNNITANVPDGGAADYDTLEAAFSRRFGSGVYVDASVDYTRKNDLRSAASTSNSPLTQSDPIGSAFFLNPYPSVSNRQTTTVWEFHVSARYELPLAIGVGANIRTQSGWNYARVISVALPNAGTQRFWADDLDGARSPNVPLLSLRVDKRFTVGRYRLTALADVFNLTNSNAVTNFNLVNGTSYNQVNGALDPRTAQIGVRFDF